MAPVDPAPGPDAGPGPGASDAAVLPEAPAQKEVVFTIPGPDAEADMSIENRLLELIAMTEDGSSIRVSMFSWTRDPVAEALVDAFARGVDVRVVIDHGASDLEPARILRDGLGDDRVVACGAGTACIGDGINHNKFFLWSRTSDGAENVVAQSSANLTNTQLQKHNNLVIIRDDPALYDGYMQYWDDLAARSHDLDYYRSVEGAGTKAYFFPRRSGDTIVNILENVDCSGGGDIRVAMAIFSDARVEVAQALRTLARNGCSVRAVLNDPGPDIEEALDGEVDYVDYFGRPEHDGVHSKYLLVDGDYDGAHRRLVWTGSHNYTGRALHDNDETLLKLDDETIFQAFWDDWETMRARAEGG